MSRTLMVVGGGEEALPGISKARHMGLDVFLTDGDVTAPGFRRAQHSAIASTYDIRATVQAALETQQRLGNIRGVIAFSADVPATVAAVAEALHLHGLPKETAELGLDKLRMKAFLEASGVPVGWGMEVKHGLFMNHLQRLKRLIVKPVDSRGSRGVLFVEAGATQDELDRLFDVAQWHSPSGRVMIEEYLDGPQLSVETVVCSDGTPVMAACFDRNYSRLPQTLPHVVEDGAQAPSSLPEHVIRRTESVTAHAAAAISAGCACTLKWDVVFTGLPSAAPAPVIIEAALRLSGGYMSAEAVPMHNDVDLLRAAIRIALGEDVQPKDVQPKFSVPTAIRYEFPEGRTVTDHTQRGAHAVACGFTVEQAARNARRLLGIHDEKENGQ